MRYFAKLPTFIALFLFFCLSHPVSAQSGCDHVVDGTSIQAGINSLSNGQTLCVKSGVYEAGIAVPSNPNGPSLQNITIKSHPSNTTPPIIDGGYNRRMVRPGNGVRGIAPNVPDNNNVAGFNLRDIAPGATIDGFIIQNIPGVGVLMTGPNQTVKNNKIYWTYSTGIRSNNTQSTVETRPRNLNILNNVILFPTVQNLDPVFNPPGPPDLTTSAIKIGNCRGPIRIAGNYAAFSYGEGFDIGKGCEGTADNPIIVENNTLHDNNHVSLYAVHPRYVHFRNNTVYSTNQTSIYSDGLPADGIRITNERGGDLNSARDIYIYNNLVYNQKNALEVGDDGFAYSNIYVGFNTFVSGPDTGNLTNFKNLGNGIVENNIFHFLRRKNATGKIVMGENNSNFTFRKNIWTQMPELASVRSNSDFIGDPKLANYDFNVTLTNFPSLGYANDQYLNYSDVNLTTNFTINNYKLTAQSSEAINQAALRQAFDGFTPPLLPFEKDFLFASRSNPDIGSLEYGGVPGPTHTPAPSPTQGPPPTGGDEPEDWDLDNDGDVDVYDFNRFVRRVMMGNEVWSNFSSFVNAFRNDN